MEIINFIFLSICVLTVWICIKWYKMKMFWKKKGISQSTIHPLYGSLTFLLRINPNKWLLDIYKQYADPYVGTWLFWRPGLIVNDPHIGHNILVKDSYNFRNRLVGTGEKDDLGSLNLFTCDDPLWSYIRKHLTATFTPAKLRGWNELYRTKSEDLIVRIKSDNALGKINNLKSLFADYSTDVIGESAFGIKCEATKNHTGHLREMTKEFEKYSLYRGIQWSSMFFFPELADLLGFTFWPKHTMVYFKKVFNMIVEERGGYDKDTKGDKDLLDALLKMNRDSTKNNKDLDKVVLISNAMIFLQGGYDTTSTTLTYAIYELAHRPLSQKILYEELIDAKSKTECDRLGPSELEPLPYLNAVLKETLRKYPVMGWMDRVAKQEYQVDKNLIIPAGTAVLINVMGIQHDPKYYPDPEQFLPERFLPQNDADKVPHTFLPFGEGPRVCIGKSFSWPTMRSALAAIIQNFVIEPFPNTPVPNEVEFDRRGIFLQPDGILSVDFVSRP